MSVNVLKTQTSSQRLSSLLFNKQLNCIRLEWQDISLADSVLEESRPSHYMGVNRFVSCVGSKSPPYNMAAQVSFSPLQSFPTLRLSFPLFGASDYLQKLSILQKRHSTAINNQTSRVFVKSLNIALLFRNLLARLRKALGHSEVRS
jgi:hypothetical protein